MSSNLGRNARAVNVLIPHGDYQELQSIAENERTSVSSVVRRFVGQCIDKSKEEA